MIEDIFRGCGVEVILTSPDDFRKVRETLTRIGIVSFSKKTIWQSCHILHKRGRYAILHFKEMFKIDRKNSSLTEDDLARRNRIVTMLSEWNLIKVIDPSQIKSPLAEPNEVRVISHKDKQNWNLVAKYTIGVHKNDE